MRFVSSLVLSALVAVPVLAKGEAAPAQPDLPPELLAQLQEMKKARDEMGFKEGPMQGDLMNATINVAAEQSFLNAVGAKKWAMATSGQSNGNEVGYLENDSWSVLFEYADEGHVKDDDKDDIDKDEILKGYKEGTTESNKTRAAQGIGTFNVSTMRWELEPYYNPETHSLEYAIAVNEDGTNAKTVNFATKVLGRTGYMDVTLMFGEDVELKAALPAFRETMKTFAYKAGNTYGEYRDGDKLATYGIAALAGGGALAIAAKTGLLGSLAKFAKVIIVGIAAAGAAVWKGITSLFRKKGEE
jgi:uncharacterized membrane-anchored protein